MMAVLCGSGGVGERCEIAILQRTVRERRRERRREGE
jgi:hypothetical protein